MNTRQVDILNTGLIVISLVVAFKIPFELFLFSYAVLGPLHYLTEISWLEERKYFSSSKHLPWVLIALCTLVSLSYVFRELPAWENTKNFHDTINTGFVGQVFSFLHEWSPYMLFVALTCAFAVVFIEKIFVRLGLIVFSMIAAIFFHLSPLFIKVIGAYLPTVIHVYVFTILFMLYGALKEKSGWGYLNVGLLLLVIMIIAGARTDANFMPPSDYVRNSFESTKFQYTVMNIAELIKGKAKHAAFSMVSGVGLKVQIFLAFAYTYHYLNWFSKTSIIKWHKVPKRKIILIFGIWLISLIVYMIDYKIGFTFLLFLSFLHVFLELPLNWHSILNIIRAVGGKSSVK